MKLHLANALIAGAITAIGGLALWAGISTSSLWLATPGYLLMSPGLVVAFFLGLGSGAHGAVVHTDAVQYILCFLIWWGIFSLARRATPRPKQ